MNRAVITLDCPPTELLEDDEEFLELVMLLHMLTMRRGGVLSAIINNEPLIIHRFEDESGSKPS
jgi:hypothetical protein